MPAEGVRRPAWAEVSSAALAHNVDVVTTLLGASALCAVVKANGYGHGAAIAAQSLLGAGADSLAVAIIDEGIELRDAGFTEPILLLAEIPLDDRGRRPRQLPHADRRIARGRARRGGRRRDRARAPPRPPQGRHRHAPDGRRTR